MAEKGGRELFRKKSLERLSSPERLDLLLEVVDRKSWVPLVSIGVLIAGLLAWSVFARIPINVEGRGILVRPRTVVEFHSPGPGRVVSLEVEVGERVRRGQLLVSIQRTDLEEQLRLLKEKAAQLTAQSRESTAPVDAPGTDDLPALDGGPSLRDHIERSRSHARSLYDERLATIGEEERRLDAQDRVARELSQSLRERLAAHRGLLEQGFVSRADLDAIEEDLMQSLERLYDLETQRGAMRTAQLEAEEVYFDRMQTIAEWSFDLEQSIAEVHREIGRVQVQLDRESRVVSDHEGTVLELNVSPGAFPAQGERLGAMEIAAPSSQLTSVTYFRVKDGKRLRENLSIQITPDTVERARYGSMKGVVRSISPFPVSLEEATSIVGNRVVAQSLIESGFLIAVSADLVRSESDPAGYEWTSSGGPEDLEVTPGTTTTARVAVERERPIALVIPLLKSATGID